MQSACYLFQAAATVSYTDKQYEQIFDAVITAASNETSSGEDLASEDRRSSGEDLISEDKTTSGEDLMSEDGAAIVDKILPSTSVSFFIYL